MGVKEAAVYRAYSYAALSVQICCTLGARWLHFSGTIFLLVLCWTISMTYAVLSVYLCWTIGIPMLYLWYQNALLFWYRFFYFFTMQYQGELRVHSSFYYSKTYPWGYEGGVRVKNYPHTYPHTLCRCLSVCYGKRWGCEGKKRKTFFYKKMNIHRHILYIIRTFFLDITLLTKSYGRRLIGRHKGISPPHNIYHRK